MDDKMFCPICGESTRIYMGNARKDKLCGKHANMLKREEIFINENGLFVDSKTKKILNKEYNEKKEIEKQEEVNYDSYIVRCIACGKETKNGNLFCGSCYHKYKNMQILVRINKCKEIELLDESYEGLYTCKDGHVVKSKSELNIDNYLFDNGISHAYEKAISIDANPAHDIHPDFYLPNYNGKGDIYIEHWGFNSNNIDYTNTRKYKIDIFKKLGLTVICTNENDQKDVSSNLNRKLKFFEIGKVNFDED